MSSTAHPCKMIAEVIPQLWAFDEKNQHSRVLWERMKSCSFTSRKSNHLGIRAPDPLNKSVFLSDGKTCCTLNCRLLSGRRIFERKGSFFHFVGWPSARRDFPGEKFLSPRPFSGTHQPCSRRAAQRTPFPRLLFHFILEYNKIARVPLLTNK